MKLGDYVRYRERIKTDPPVSGDPNRDGWGNMGIVTMLTEAVFHNDIPEPAVEFLDSSGSFHLARAADVYVISTLEDEETMWRMWGDI